MSSNKRRRISKKKHNQRHKTIKARYPKKGAIESIADEIDNIIVDIDDEEARIQGEIEMEREIAEYSERQYLQQLEQEAELRHQRAILAREELQNMNLFSMRNIKRKLKKLRLKLLRSV